MNRGYTCKILFSIILTWGLHNNFQVLAQIPPSVGIVLDVPFAPTPVKADGKAYLLYELHITNFRLDSLELTRLDIIADKTSNQPLASYIRADLENQIARPGLPDKTPNKRLISGGYRAVVFLQIRVDPAAVPVSLYHRLFFKVDDSQQQGGEVTLEGARVAVQRNDPVVISAPLRGAGWVAGNILSNESDHRRAIIPLDGKGRIAQRYAIDWIKIGEDGKAFRADPRKNANWYGYGAEVLAVADATVIDVKDGFPDNPSFVFPKPVVNSMLGNYVLLDLGRGHFALYAHLQPGSIKVKVGQRVRQGQALGLLGNSGNSPVPHLHFHIVDANTPLGAEGVPYVFTSFVVQGSAESFDSLMTSGGLKKPSAKADRKIKEMPTNYAVVSFSLTAP